MSTVDSGVNKPLVAPDFVLCPPESRGRNARAYRLARRHGDWCPEWRGRFFWHRYGDIWIGHTVRFNSQSEAERYLKRAMEDDARWRLPVVVIEYPQAQSAREAT